MPEDVAASGFDEPCLYRRVSSEHFDPTKLKFPDWMAFRPRENDDDGISLYLSDLSTPREVAITARAKPAKQYFVAVVPVSSVKLLGLTLQPDDPLKLPPGDEPNPAHRSIPELNANVRRLPETAEKARLLAESCIKVLGPFSVDSPADGASD